MYFELSTEDWPISPEIIANKGRMLSICSLCRPCEFTFQCYEQTVQQSPLSLLLSLSLSLTCSLSLSLSPSLYPLPISLVSFKTYIINMYEQQHSRDVPPGSEVVIIDRSLKTPQLIILTCELSVG